MTFSAPTRSRATGNAGLGDAESSSGDSFGWLSAGMFALAAALATTSLLGPFAFDVIRYRLSGLLRSQLIGADATTLIVVVPLCLIIGMLAVRGHRAAPVLALGPACYTLYLSIETIVGPDYTDRPGNNERYFPLFLATFLLAGAVAICAWRLLDRTRLPALAPRRMRIVGSLLVGYGTLLLIGRYLPVLTRVMQGRSPNSDYLAGPTVFWTVALEDLGVVIPAMIAVGVGMWKARPATLAVCYAVVGWATLVPGSVAAMGLAMWLEHQPSASLAGVVLLASMAVLFLVPAGICYPPLLNPRQAVPGRPKIDADLARGAVINGLSAAASVVRVGS